MTTQGQHSLDSRGGFCLGRGQSADTGQAGADLESVRLSERSQEVPGVTKVRDRQEDGGGQGLGTLQ